MQRTSITKTLAAVTTAGVLTLGLAGTAAAAGNDGGSGSGAAPSAGQEQARPRHPGARREAIKVAAQAAATTIGVDVSELKAAVQGGQTVGAFAESKGVSAQSVVDAVVGALNDRVDQAVSDGKIDAAQATKLKDRIPTFADRLVNSLPKRVHGGTPAPSAG